MLEQRERVYAEKECNERVLGQPQRMFVKEKRRNKKAAEEEEEASRCNEQSAMLFPFSHTGRGWKDRLGYVRCNLPF